MKKITLSAIILLFVCGISYAQKMPFQGKLTKDGKNVSGTKDMKFSIAYDSASTTKTWIETLTGVSITDGYYSVVLGETTPIPSEIYDFKKEAKLRITIDGENLSAITLYAPIVSNSPNGNITIKNPEGKKRTFLNYFKPNDSGSLLLNGRDDSTKVIIGTRGNTDPTKSGIEGAIYLYAEKRKQQVKLEAKNIGGSLVLRQINDEKTALNSYVNAGTYGDGNAYISIAGKNKSSGKADNTMVSIYAHGDENDTETKDGWKRAGIDLFNPTGRNLVRLNTGRSDQAKDANGEFGKLIMHGKSSPNFELTGKGWENSDLGHLAIFGTSKNNDWGWANVELTTLLVGEGESKGTNGASGGFLELLNTQNGTEGTTSRLPKVQVSSFHHNSNNGNKNAGYITIYGADKKENFYLGADVNGNHGRLDIHGSNGVTKAGIGADNESGYLFLKNKANAETIKLNGENGKGVFSGIVTAQNITETSDRRLKKNIRPLTNNLKNIKKLQGVNFHWKKDKTKKENMGFIAQEVEEVYPELVHTDEKGMKSVAYANLVAALVEAIKEMDTKISKLEIENKTLKAETKELASLRKDVDYLMKMIRRSTHARQN